VLAHLPYFWRCYIFHFCSSKLFQTGCHCLVSLPKQAAAVLLPLQLFPAYILPSSERSDIFDPILLIRSLPYFCTKSPHFLSINSSVLILCLIGKVFTGILAKHSHILPLPFCSPPSFSRWSIWHATCNSVCLFINL